MRFDSEAALFEVSVRELAYRDEEEGPTTPFLRLRTALGQAVHARHRRERSADGVDSEVPLRFERQVDGVLAVVRGRADIVLREGELWVVEEVKSVLGDPSVDLMARDHHRASLQARLYALALELEGRLPVTARLRLVGVEGGSRSLELAYDRGEVEAELDRALRECLARAREASERGLRRRAAADGLRFPHDEPRPGQKELVEDVSAALSEGRPVLLEAPTGTGKTAVALFAAMRAALRRGAPTWYLTAKTTQRDAVISTFEATGAPAAGLRAIALRRKEAMCPPGHLRCHPDHCPLLADFTERAPTTLESLATIGALRPETIFERGAAAALCPYELMHALAAGADLVVGDYNHVYDRGRIQALAGGRLIVVDEAHNLADRARGYASVFVSRRALRALETPGLPHAETLGGLARRLRHAIDAVLEEAASEERAGHDGCATAELDRTTFIELGLEAGLAALRYAHDKHQRGEIEACDPVSETLEAVGKLGALLEEDRSLTGYVAGPGSRAGPGVGLLCLDASRRLERRHRRELGLVVMSATLSPLSFYADVLGLARLGPVEIAAPSVFPSDNRIVCIVPTLRTTLAEREESAPEIARLIERVLSVRPGNYAVFFPSFRHLGQVMPHLRLGDMCVLAQPPLASEALRARVLESLRRADRPSLLLAVAGGIFAEGIDLVGEALVGAIVVGPSLPAADFERRLMQAHYDEAHEAGFAYAMAYPGMQRVVQAAGRVHRSPDDRGIIVLIGSRFAESPFYEAIPSHWYDHAPEELFCEDPVPRVERFWNG